MLGERIGQWEGPGQNQNQELWTQLRVDIWGVGGEYSKEGDRVGAKLNDFRLRMEALCRPVIDKSYKRSRGPTIGPAPV